LVRDNVIYFVQVWDVYVKCSCIKDIALLYIGLHLVLLILINKS